MDNLTTAFLFTKDISVLRGMQFGVIIGVISLIVGIGMILVAIKKPKWFIGGEWETFLHPGIFITFGGIISFGICLFFLISYNQRYNMLENIYSSQNYKIAEGAVEVLSIQPKGGHAPGDIIQIDGVKFEIDYYSGDFGYETSIAHQGILTKGQYVKVFYYDGRILRIDLK